MRRSLSSCLEATRMWRRIERASFEKKPSTRLSQEPCLGVKVNSNLPAGCSANQARVSRETCAECLSRTYLKGFQLPTNLTTFPSSKELHGVFKHNVVDARWLAYS